jgi:hypothetical protein
MERLEYSFSIPAEIRESVYLLYPFKGILAIPLASHFSDLQAFATRSIILNAGPPMDGSGRGFLSPETLSNTDGASRKKEAVKRKHFQSRRGFMGIPFSR